MILQSLFFFLSFLSSPLGVSIVGFMVIINPHPKLHDRRKPLANPEGFRKEWCLPEATS